MLLSEIEYSYNVRVHLLSPSAASPVLGGALFHYPGAQSPAAAAAFPHMSGMEQALCQPPGSCGSA
jgi:hypothetical protein